MKIKYLFPLLALLGACSKEQTPQKRSVQELRINLHAEPPCLDPRKATDTTSINLIEMCFEGLMRHSEEGKIALGVAKEYQISEDQKTYTFVLRQAHWSDGTPITADDFINTWATILDPRFASEFASEFYVIKNGKAYSEGKVKIEEVGMKAVDPHTIQITLAYPIPYFLELLSTSYFLPTPVHIVKKAPGWAKKCTAHFVSNGPFKMTKWRHYDEVLIEKNPQYWDQEAVKLQKIHLPIIQDETTELSLFENNELDWMGAPFSTLPLDALPTLRKKYTINTFPIAGIYYYLFNTQAFPFKNENMRKAFALAIDRQTIIDNILQGNQLPAFSAVPPVLWLEAPKEVSFKDNDVKEAQRLFALGVKELGYTKETLPPIILTYNTSEGHHKIAQAIQQQWKKAFGLSVQLENKEWKVFLDELNKHQFQVARLGGIASYNDPITFLDEGSMRRSQWENAEYTALLEQAMRLNDPLEREKALQKAEAILMQQMPTLPLYFYTFSYIKKPYVKGVIISKTGHVDFKYTYIDKSDE